MFTKAIIKCHNRSRYNICFIPNKHKNAYIYINLSIFLSPINKAEKECLHVVEDEHKHTNDSSAPKARTRDWLWAAG